MNSVDHYENFPVASWLCPLHLRAAILTIYKFARTADDIADEGEAPMHERLNTLSSLRRALLQVESKKDDFGPWQAIMKPLSTVFHIYKLPITPFLDLLEAFEQDIRFTGLGLRFANDRQLFEYCQHSASPIGRLLLHLYNITDDLLITQSDKICTALQLINFWQDLTVDIGRNRWYPSVETMANFSVTDDDLRRHSYSLVAESMLEYYCQQARQKMIEGLPLAKHLPGRIGWELRLVIQGGLLILDKIQQLKYRSWKTRPSIRKIDIPKIFWRACQMSWQ